MSKNKSQIYLKAEKQWVSVSEEFHKAYFREIDLFRRKQIRHGFASAPVRNGGYAIWIAARVSFNVQTANTYRLTQRSAKAMTPVRSSTQFPMIP